MKLMQQHNYRQLANRMVFSYMTWQFYHPYNFHLMFVAVVVSGPKPREIEWIRNEYGFDMQINFLKLTHTSDNFF